MNIKVTSALSFDLRLWRLNVAVLMLNFWCNVELLRAVSSQVFNISKDGDTTDSVYSLLQCLITPTVKKVVSSVWMEFPASHYVPFASCPLTGHHWEESGPVFFIPPFRHIYHTNPLEPSLLQAQESQLSQPLLVCHMCQRYEDIWQQDSNYSYV